MKPVDKKKVITTDLREVLKSIVQDEITRLPETLQALEPKDRVNIFLKLMPFVFPKITTVDLWQGEP